MGPDDGPAGWEPLSSVAVNAITQAPDRNLAMELVRVTEASALAAERRGCIYRFRISADDRLVSLGQAAILIPETAT